MHRLINAKLLLLCFSLLLSISSTPLFAKTSHESHHACTFEDTIIKIRDAHLNSQSIDNKYEILFEKKSTAYLESSGLNEEQTFDYLMTKVEEKNMLSLQKAKLGFARKVMQIQKNSINLDQVDCDLAREIEGDIENITKLIELSWLKVIQSVDNDLQMYQTQLQLQ